MFKVPKLFDRMVSICRIVNSLNIPLSVETVCVFTAPIFSANAAWATYLLTKVLSLSLSHISMRSIHTSVCNFLGMLMTFGDVLMQEVKGVGAGLTAAALLGMVIHILLVFVIGGSFWIIGHVRTMPSSGNGG